MSPGELRTLYAFDRWANGRMLDAADGLSREAYTRDLGSSFPSIRDTFVHILWSEWIWLRRWTGTSPSTRFDPAEFRDVEALRSRWREVEAELAAFLDTLTPEALVREVSYVNLLGETWCYPLQQMMQHVINHSTYHRGQVVTMLRQVGAAPPSTDLLIFVDENRPGGS